MLIHVGMCGILLFPCLLMDWKLCWKIHQSCICLMKGYPCPGVKPLCTLVGGKFMEFLRRISMCAKHGSRMLRAEFFVLPIMPLGHIFFLSRILRIRGLLYTPATITSTLRKIGRSCFWLNRNISVLSLITMRKSSFVSILWIPWERVGLKNPQKF